MVYLRPFTILLFVFLLQGLIHNAEAGKKKRRWNWEKGVLESASEENSNSDASRSSDSNSDEETDHNSGPFSAAFSQVHSFSSNNAFHPVHLPPPPLHHPFPHMGPPYFRHPRPLFGRPPPLFMTPNFEDDDPDFHHFPFKKPVGTSTFTVAVVGGPKVGGSRPSSSQSKPKPDKKPVVVEATSSKPSSQKKPLPSTNPEYTRDGCDYCTRSVCNPTVKPSSNFNVGKDVSELSKAIVGLGTDEQKLVNILTKRSESQVQKIVNEYGMTGRTLPHDIEGDTSLKFKAMLLAIVTPLPLFYAEEIHKALDDKDTSTMIEILTSLSDCAIREVSVQFENVYKKSLPVELGGKTNMNFKKFILALARGNRDPNEKVDKTKAKEDATKLINSGAKKWLGSDEDTFIDIFATRSFAQLREILREYDSQRKSEGGTIEKDIEKAFWGKLEEGLLKLVKQIKNQPLFFAEELNEAIGGKVTPNDNAKLIRIMRGRSGIDLRDIQRQFDSKFDKPLADRISQGTYFDYRKSLLGILNVEM